MSSYNVDMDKPVKVLAVINHRLLLLSAVRSSALPSVTLTTPGGVHGWASIVAITSAKCKFICDQTNILSARPEHLDLTYRDRLPQTFKQYV